MATGTVVKPPIAKGSFREDYCDSHVQVEWDVSCEALQQCGNALRSPVFKIEKQYYRLECERVSEFTAMLFVQRIGSSVSETPALCWCGLKLRDGPDQNRISYRRLVPTYDCKSWTYLSSLAFFASDTLQGTSLTLFFRMNVSRAPLGVESCTHGTPQMPAAKLGSIRLEEHYCHKHVEWDIIETYFENLTSPVFKIDTQMYFFKIRPSWDTICLQLFRLGRAVEGPAAVLRFWIGLKSGEGTCHPRNIRAKLDLREDFGLWTPVATWTFQRYVLKLENITLDRSLTVFFRMNVESCTHGTHQEAPLATGTIQEEQCSSHKQVEWNVSYEVATGQDIFLASPVFKIGDQEYFLESCFRKIERTELRLFRLGHSVQGPGSTVRCWAGVKDSFLYNNYSQQLDLREDFGLWTEMALLISILDIEHESQRMAFDSRLIFVFRMNTEPTVPAMCTHDPADRIASSVSGSIREEECSSHKHVEWDLKVELLSWLGSWNSLTSSAFKIGTQLYYMEMDSNMSCRSSFRLYRLGNSVRGPASFARCWAGVKHPNGNYHLQIFSQKLDLQEDLGLWTVVASLTISHPEDLSYLRHIQELTLFFRMNVDTIAEEMCSHGPIEKYSAHGEGRIQMQNCNSHKHVLWTVSYETWWMVDRSPSSPVFKVGNQLYQLRLYYDSSKSLELQLHRSGSAVRGPASSFRCWAGLKRGDGSYHHHMQVAELDLIEECSLPAIVACFPLPSHSDLERTHVTVHKRLTFFLHINVPQSTIYKRTCAHGAAQMCPPGDGSIRANDDNTVEWDVKYEAPRKYTHFSTSPVFKLGTQFYLLELCYKINGSMFLRLYRFGPSVEARVQWSAGLKSDRGTHKYRIKGEIDLRTDCGLWTMVKIMCVFRQYDLEQESLANDGPLAFFFLIGEEARGSHGFFDVAMQTDRNYKEGHEDKIFKLSQGFIDVAVQTDGNSRHKHDDKIFKHSQGTVDVPVQADGNCKRGPKDRFSEGSEDLEKLREHFKLWLKHPEEGDRIRRLRMKEFDKGWKYLEEHRNEDKEPSIFAA